jgi:hypothetical protein
MMLTNIELTEFGVNIFPQEILESYKANYREEKRRGRRGS